MMTPDKSFDVIVIGGGAIGASSAYQLAKQGANVALLEEFDLNTQASGRNAGSLHGQIQYEPFEELGIGWAKQFLHGLSILADSLEIWKGLSDELGVDLEVSSNGGLMIAENETNLRHLEEKVRLENSIGIDSRMLSRSELQEKAPYISAKMVGAAFCPIEGKANPLVVAPAFADAARRHGAVISTRTEVLEIAKNSQGFTISTSAGQFRGAKVLITANAGIPKLTAGLGKRIPISDVPVQVSVTEQIEKFVHHLVYFTSEKLTFKQANSGSLLIGGGWPARYDEKQNPILNPDSLRSNLRVALKVVPRIADVKVIRTWVGTGNGTEDHNPIIDKFPGVDGLYVGMYPYMGFTASPLMGRLLAELILTGKCQRDISHFSIERLL
ncbi:MAG: NAD(P)/FAD-dependent oxidoreductase [Candidatus Nanopelagicaceae bacterium]|jgi:glycine/D-amino acid oxidase-like deaminating enzyme